MNAANYLIEVNVALLLLAVGYWWLLRNEDDFRIKRFYLLGSLLVSVTAPFFSWPAPVDAVPTLTHVLPSYWLPEIVITSDGSSPAAHTPVAAAGWRWVGTIYWAGVCMAVLVFMYRTGRILHLRMRGGRQAWRGYRVVQSPALHSTFSFAGTIYLAQNRSIDEPEAQLMLQHEAAHVDCLHSYDILFTQLIGLFCWFNPVVRWYRTELAQQHEFEADAAVATPAGAAAYAQLLAEEALHQAGFSLAHHFNSSFTVKRIAMLQKLRTRLAFWKWPVIALVSAVAIAFVSCQDQLADLKVATENSTAALLWPKEVQDKLDELHRQQPHATFSVYELNEEGQKALNKIDGQSVTQVHVVASTSAGMGGSYAIVQQGGVASQLGDLSADRNMIFTVVEETATPKEGIESLYRYIAAQLRYPAQARREGVEGKVYLEFTVNTDGTLSDIRVVRGIGGGCDEEAVRVLEGSPAWNPGRQRGVTVRQKMVLPIIFKLGVSDKSLEVGQSGNATLPEMVVVGKSENQFVIELARQNEAGKVVLTGTVRNKNQEPLTGANIVVAGTTVGTVTDSQGKFSLRAPTDRGNLVISLVGYPTQTMSF